MTRGVAPLICWEGEPHEGGTISERRVPLAGVGFGGI